MSAQYSFTVVYHQIYLQIHHRLLILHAIYEELMLLMCFFLCLLSYFLLNKRTGFLIIKENAPPGSYEFQVRVSDGVWPDAVSGVMVYVRELRDEAIYNSGSLRLAGTVQYTCPLNLDL